MQNIFENIQIVNKYSFRITKAPDDGVYVHGLYIEGARWSKEEKSIVEQLPKIILNDFPCIHFFVSIN